MQGVRLEIAPGITLWRGALTSHAQRQLIDEIFAQTERAPFYRPRLPLSGKPFSVAQTNFGPLGWLSDKDGYRYSETHPETGQRWPAIPQQLLQLWAEATGYAAPPECCLVNLYRNGARMGLHQDRDERALDAPVLSISLGNTALFRIGGTTRREPTKSLRLESGDLLTFGGPARLAFHGIDRVMPGTSGLVADDGRINLTLRRVVPPKIKTPDQGADRASPAPLSAGCREGMTGTLGRTPSSVRAGGQCLLDVSRPSKR